jgi:hypothetical protein
MSKDPAVIFELLSLADHAAADAAPDCATAQNLGPEWRITYQPDGDAVSRTDEVGFVRFFDETGGWL